MADNKPKITEEIVEKIEDVLEERKNRKDRRKVEMNLPDALERRSGDDRREMAKAAKKSS